jgi:secreted trypsin-like serine protease
MSAWSKGLEDRPEGGVMSRLPEAKHQRLVQEAIAHATAVAGDDDQEFLRALRGKYFERHRQETRDLPSLRSARPIRSSPAGAAGDRGVESFHIYEDPRFVANARELARRTGAGMRILGGQTVPAGKFPDCVAIGSDSQWGCTGTLIAPTVVITAGHCSAVATRIFIGSDVSKKGTILAVSRRERHPDYHRKTRHNDLMLLFLEKPAAVPPRKIVSDPGLVDRATDGRVVGFGATEASGTFGYGVKRQTDVPVASPNCRGKVNGHDDSVSYGCDRDYEIVAGKPLLQNDTCNGDSGGPFYVLEDGEWYLAGATSRATDSAVNNCGDGGIYVRLDRYKEWLASVIASEERPKVRKPRGDKR